MFGGFHEDSVSVGIPAMNFVVSLVHILLVALLQPSSVKTASINKEAEKSKNEVVSFTKVYEQSICQPRDVLVDVFQAYPEDTEHIYTPSCVVLKRCGGCCNDEGKECVPAESRNVTLQLQRFRPRVIKEMVDLSFTEHVSCVCRSKPDVLAEEKKK